MSTDPDEIRRDIERTRTELSGNVNALGEKVNPASIARRQKDRVRDAATGVKDAVMGSAADGKQSAGDAAAAVGDAVTAAPVTVARRAQGSPIAAGLIAFGVGLLASSLLPASRVERHAAEAVKEQAEPLISQLTDAAKDAAENLKEPAQQALESVKDTTTDAVDTVKDHGAAAAQDIKDQAQDAAGNVQRSAT
jgi:hypothetical protein